MKKLKLLSLFMAWLVLVPGGVGEEIWTVIAIDPKGDGRDASVADIAQLSYRYDKQLDLLWFRVTLYRKINQEEIGAKIVVDTGGEDATKKSWWGANKEFRFDKLVSVRMTRAGGHLQGRVGVTDAAVAKANDFNNPRQDDAHVRVEGDSIVVGVKRTNLTDKMKMNLIVAVGSRQEWNDEIPNGRSVTLDLSATRPTRGLREIDVNRNNFRFPSEYKTLADNQPAQVINKGCGCEPLILIPGIYSGEGLFDQFMARNQSQYEFYVLTPPGLNGTPARPLPPESASYGEFSWTRRLERDILDLIDREKLNRPMVIVHGFPGSLAIEELASQHPELLGGIIEIASMPLQFSPSPKDPTWKKPALPEERIEMVNEGWAQKWFKYVTPETWESNNYAATMFANNSERAEQVRQQVEAALLPVKIRYLCEFMASDHTAELRNLKVAVLALRPGFNEKVLADPANGWYKASLQDAWDAFSSNPQIQLLTIPNARALILEDQPKLADEAISRFIQRVRQANEGRME